MFLIEVIPLVKIPYPGSQTFQYFSSKELKKGSLVSIPIGKAKSQGVVSNCDNIIEKKLEIRKSNISLRSIKGAISSEAIVNNAQLDLAIFISEKYIESLGICIKSFLPPNILKRKKLPQDIFPKDISKKKYSGKPILIVKADRLNDYIKNIKETIKQGKTVLFLSPEILKATIFLKDFKRISDKIAFYHSELKDSQKLIIWQDVCKNNLDIVIGTRSALSLPYSNLGLIIVDEEDNPGHKSWDQHPKFNAKIVAQELAKIHSAQIILGTNFLTTDSFYHVSQKEYALIEEKKKNILKIEVVDMQNEKKWGNFSLFSEKLQKEIKKNLEEKKQILLFVNRKGLATSIICKDCGYVEKCPNCNTPMVYHKQKDSGILICHYCLTRKRPPVYCPACKSTRIRYAGIGIDKVFQETKNLLNYSFSDNKTKIVQLDAGLIEKQQKDIIDDFKKKKIGILITTQIIFKYPGVKTNLCATVLPDFLLNIPDFSANEKALRVFLNLGLLSKKLMIQTYKSDLSIFKYLKNNDLPGFIKEESEQREIFFYPPFSEIIKLTFSSTSLKLCIFRAKELEKQLLKVFTPKQILGPSSAFISKIKGRYIWNIIIKSNPIEKEKIDRLKEIIPSSWEVEVDPESML
jgi:primosomal protein N' (replication factor Y)